jgi:hypothetical protein
MRTGRGPLSGMRAAALPCPMASKQLRCRMGLHSYVRAHPADERYEGPDQQVCRLCGKRRGTSSDIPPAGLTGGAAG